MTTSSSTSVKPSSAREAAERSISPGSSAGAARRFSFGSSAGWPSRAGAWASRAGSKRPVPSHHGQRTRCGSPPRPEISSPLPRQAVQVLGSCSIGALTAESLEARGRDGALRRLRGAADRRVGGLVGRAASGASSAAPRGRSAGAAGRRRGTRSRRWPARRRGTGRPGSAGTPSGERATSASNASGFIAVLELLRAERLGEQQRAGGRRVLVAERASARSRRCSSTASPRCPARAARPRSPRAA